MTDSTTFYQLVTFIATHRDMAQMLLPQHSDDGTGHCQLCTSGAQAGRHVWPYQTYLAAAGKQWKVATTG